MVANKRYINLYVTVMFLVAFANFGRTQFVVSPGSSITIKQGSSLYIDDNLLLKSNAASSGYFVDQTLNGDYTITGNTTVERYLTANGWHNTSSPVSNESSDVYTNTDLVFYYNETLILNDWNFGWVMYQGLLNVMKGYDIFLPSGAITVSYIASGAETLNTGEFSIGVTRTNVANGEIESHKGWNLIGNPYPSPVDWLTESGWNKSNINDAKYIWDPDNSNYTIFLGGNEPIGINGGTRYIPSNQGFWVQAIKNGSVQINNTCRVGSMPDTPDYYKNTSLTYPLVSLEVSGNGHTDQTIVRFIAGTTDRFDLNFDAVKLYSNHQMVPQISSLAGKTIMAINTLPQVEDNLEVILKFNCATAGYYFISIHGLTNLDPSIELYLKDELNQNIINLSKNSTYGFHHDPTNNQSRFKLFFNPSFDIINNITPESAFSAYAWQNMITIIKKTQKMIEGNIIVYNLCGQKMLCRPISNNSRTDIYVDFPTGFYIVSIHTDSNISNFKIRINQ